MEKKCNCNCGTCHVTVVEGPLILAGVDCFTKYSRCDCVSAIGYMINENFKIVADDKGEVWVMFHHDVKLPFAKKSGGKYYASFRKVMDYIKDKHGISIDDGDLDVEKIVSYSATGQFEVWIESNGDGAKIHTTNLKNAPHRVRSLLDGINLSKSSKSNREFQRASNRCLSFADLIDHHRGEKF